MDQLAGFTEEGRKLALDRFRLLQPHLEDKRSLKAVASAAGIPFRTAQRWVSQYRQFGLAALARKKRTDTRHHMTSMGPTPALPSANRIRVPSLFVFERVELFLNEGGCESIEALVEERSCGACDVVRDIRDCLSHRLRGCWVEGDARCGAHVERV